MSYDALISADTELLADIDRVCWQIDRVFDSCHDEEHVDRDIALLQSRLSVLQAQRDGIWLVIERDHAEEHEDAHSYALEIEYERRAGA